ncbi:MAG: DUF262 domain-containing protein [Carnobacterium maltaromaticum]
MNFIPENLTIRNLIKTYPTFKIPIFQRDYSWEEQYYSRFIDDIIEAITLDNKSQLISRNYFLGTMVFSNNTQSKETHVVDGQQRLTVITILLSLISENLIKNGEKGLGDATFKYVKDTNDDNEYFTHLSSPTSYPYLEGFIQSLDKSNAPEVRTEEEKNLKDTYDYFTKALDMEKLIAKNKKFSKSKYVDILLAIRNQILDSQVISIVTTDRDSAFMIFEILNAKGKNLASIDLIKNTLFEKFHGNANSLESRAENLWEDTKKNLRERENSIGLVTFYRHYWISKYKKVTNVKLYDSFKDNITPKNEDTYISFLKDLEQESKTYLKIVTPSLTLDYSDRKQDQWLVQSLKTLNNTFNVVQTRLALLALFDIKKRNLISTQKFKETILYIENFVFMYTGVAKRPANIYELRFSNFAIKLRDSKGKSDTNSIIKEYLYDKFKDYTISYDEFEENFVKLSYSKNNVSSNVITKYVLNKISSHYGNITGVVEDYFWNNSSVEHILNENRETIETLNIGNLICLEEGLNREADNLDYKEKIEVYNKSLYAEVRSFTNTYKDFQLSDIEKRAKGLAKYYYENIINEK